MSRPTILTLGLLAFALALAPAPRAAAAEEPHKTEAAKAGHAAGAAAPGEAGGHAKPNILELKPSLALATLIVFGVLLLVLWKFAWGPLSKALHDREHHHEELLKQAEGSYLESQRLLAEHKAQMAQAADQVRALLDEARRDAEANAQTIVQRAQAEAEDSRNRARREIETARDQALVEIWTRSADLAVSVAGKVLARELTPDDQRRLVEAAAAELPAGPSANGHGGRA
jgi:F-type H+-transporting ATPase subunit b